jgi:hypothetical protein
VIHGWDRPRFPRRRVLVGVSLTVSAVVVLIGPALASGAGSSPGNTKSSSTTATTRTGPDQGTPPTTPSPPSTITGAPVSPVAQRADATGANAGSTRGAAVAPSSNAVSSSPPAAAPPPAPTSEIIVCESPIIDQNGVRTASETVYRAPAGTPPPSGCHLG